MTTLAEPAPEPARRRRWIHVLLTLVVGGMLADIAVGLAVHVATGRFPLLPVLAAFLVLSAIRLVGIAVWTAQRTRERAARGERDAIAHGWGWVVYKLVAAVVALVGAGYLMFAPGAERLERIFADPPAVERAPPAAEPAP